VIGAMLPQGQSLALLGISGHARAPGVRVGHLNYPHNYPKCPHATGCSPGLGAAGGGSWAREDLPA
jgi:hypothetical protein